MPTLCYLVAILAFVGSAFALVTVLPLGGLGIVWAIACIMFAVLIATMGRICEMLQEIAKQGRRREATSDGRREPVIGDG